jgi:hypothetical protein
VLRVTANVVPESTHTCVVDAIYATRMPSRGAPAILDALLEASSPSAVATDDTAVENAARALADARRDAILACTDGSAVAVTVTWSATGDVGFSLTGTRAGTAADGCVRAAARGARIDPPPTTAGSLLHPLN